MGLLNFNKKRPGWGLTRPGYKKKRSFICVWTRQNQKGFSISIFVILFIYFSFEFEPFLYLMFIYIFYVNRITEKVLKKKLYIYNSNIYIY